MHPTRGTPFHARIRDTISRVPRAGDAGGVRRRMNRLFVPVALLLLFGCAKEEPVPIQPPDLPDKYTALQQDDRTPDSMKPDPPPVTWMHGCFAAKLSKPSGLEGYSYIPRMIRLVPEAVGELGPKILFLVECQGGRRTGSKQSWRPTADGGIQINLGDGYAGVVLNCAQTSEGMSCVAVNWVDGPAPRESREFTLSRTGCS